MSSDDPNFTNLVAGMTKGSLEWTSDKATERVKNFIARLRNKELAFIKDHETIDLAREQRHTNEWESLYSTYLKDRRLRILAQVGLTLRKVENDIPRVEPLRQKVLKGFGKEGLHIAEAVQNEVLSTLIIEDISQVQSATDLTNRIEKLLNNVEKYVIFIKPGEDVDRKVREISTRLLADIPDMLIIYGCRADARRKVHTIIKKLEKTLSINYEIITTESKIKTIVIIRKNG